MSIEQLSQDEMRLNRPKTSGEGQGVVATVTRQRLWHRIELLSQAENGPTIDRRDSIAMPAYSLEIDIQ
jgi:hypothetical protein